MGPLQKRALASNRFLLFRMHWLFCVVFFFVIASFDLQLCQAEDPVPLFALPTASSRTHLLNDYLKLKRQLSHSLCGNQEEKQYSEYLKNYRSNGAYLPEWPPGKIDVQTIKKNIPLIKKKLRWIQQQRWAFEKSPLPSYENLTRPMNDLIPILLTIKEKIDTTSDPKIQKDLLLQSQKLMAKLRRLYKQFTGQIPFLLSFQFPVDHLQNRKTFLKKKAIALTASQKAANDLFFKRKIFEDGTYESPEQTSKTDLYLRSTLDTLALELQKKSSVLEENIRFDLNWAFKNLEKLLSPGKSTVATRLKEWQTRTEEIIKFYQALVQNDPNQKPSPADLIEANNKLRDYVLTQHARVYEFLSQKSEPLQAMYVLDTILENEIGDDPGIPIEEREAVSRVVVNRRFHPIYSTLDQDDPSLIYLGKNAKTNIQLSPWLNLMFKEGEFSFTYFFIPSVVRIFCPTLDPNKTNLKVALNILSSPHNKDFKALRYFSRVSMIGKIDMGKIWTDYERLPEMPGSLFRKKENKKLYASLLHHLEEHDYRYLYRFKREGPTPYYVLEIKDTPYVFSDLSPDAEIFSYRSPHTFSYFKLK